MGNSEDPNVEIFAQAFSIVLSENTLAEHLAL